MVQRRDEMERYLLLDFDAAFDAVPPPDGNVDSLPLELPERKALVSPPVIPSSPAARRGHTVRGPHQISPRHLRSEYTPELLPETSSTRQILPKPCRERRRGALSDPSQPPSSTLSLAQRRIYRLLLIFAGQRGIFV